MNRRPGIRLAIGCTLLLFTSAAAAQAPGDTARGAATGADSLRPTAADSSGAGQPSANGAASGARMPDRVPSAGAAAPSDPGAPRLPIRVGAGGPSDTTLLRACKGVLGGREAPGLLAVVFRTGTNDKDRVAAAKAVGGKLAGRSVYGEEYVRLEVGAGPLASVADRLIRQDPVVRVSPAPCPPEAIISSPSPPTPADTARAPAGQAPTPPASTPQTPERR